MAAMRDDMVLKASAHAAKGRYRRALALYMKAGDYRGAGAMMEKLGRTEQAIESYWRGGDFTRAAELLAGMGNFERAAQMFAKSGAPDRAGLALLKAGKFAEAARMFERAGEIEEAAKLYETAGRFGMAASLYESCGMRDKAIRLYEENGRKELAARLCAQSGEHIRAADLYAEMEIFSEAARSFVNAGMKQEAIEAFEKAGALNEAIELCEEIGLFDKAAQFCEETGDTERAVEFFAQAGNFAGAGRIYEEKQRYFDAARLYARDKESLPRAAELFSQTLSVDSVWNHPANSAVWDIAVAQQTGRVALALAGAEVVVLDRQGTFLWRFRVPMGVRCRSIAITPDASRLAVGTEGRSIYMLDASNRLLWKRELGGEVRGLAFADNAQMIVAGCTDGYIRVIHMEGKDLWTFQTEFKVWHLAVNDENRLIVAGTGDGGLYVFDYDGQVIWKEKTDDWLGRIAISPDGQHIALVLGQDKVRLYDLGDQRLLWEQVHRCVVQDVVFWNNERLIVCTNNETMVWDRDGQVVCREPSSDRVMRVKCGSDGETVYLGRFEEGFRVVRLHDCVIRAARCYEEIEEYATAARLYESKNELTSALDMYAKAHNFAQAAELAVQLNNNEQAGEFYEQAGAFEKAAACYEEVNLIERAAQCYDQAGQKGKASELLASLGDTERAAQLQMESGNYVAAGQLYQEAGALEKAQDAYEMALEEKALTPEAAIGLGRLYFANKRYDEVIRLLQPFRTSTEHAAHIAELLAECFIEKKQYNIAIDHYHEALAGDEENDAAQIEILYGLGCAYELAARYTEAIEVFNRILLVDYYYKDVTGRLERINEISSIFASSDNATKVGSGAGMQTVAGGGPAANATVQQARPKRYEVKRKLGEGGMGVVYEALDTKLDRVVAMKVLPSKFNGLDELKSRFVREARAVAALSHENVIAVYDIGEEWGESYIAMEFVDGKSLRQILEKKKKFPPEEALKLAKQIADGLGAAHRAGIVHRDIKPENVMISKSSQQVKLMDFGLARMDSATNLTQEGSIMGTWRYMAPEQIRGEKVTPATDIYATGVMLFEMLAGHPPFGDGDLAYHHVNTEPPALIDVEPSVPPALSDIVARCIAKDAADRYASGSELLEALAAPVMASEP